jgi:glycosyltransferase involved in cell wall biosynthesis
MRLAFLTHEPFYPPSGGGSAEASYLVRQMRERGYEVTVFCPAFAGETEIAREQGIDIVAFRHWPMGRYTAWRTPKYLAYPFLLERMVSRAQAVRPFDVLFAQHSIASVAAGRLKRRLGIPVAMNLLDFLTGFMETWPRYLMPRVLLRRLMNFELDLPRRYRADVVLTVSDRLADLLASHGCPRERLLPIYYGFDARRFPEPGRRRFHPGAAPIVVMHGSLDHHHLGNIARRAVVEVVRQMPEVVFRFVGRETPVLRHFVHRVRRRAPAARLECTGFVPYDQIAQQLDGASVGMVPYEESEGVHSAFVAKVVEYLACGLPVVSTRLESIARFFQGEPMIRFSAFQGEDFGGALVDSLRAPASHWATFAPLAQQRVRAELDWSNICRRALDFLEARLA